ESPFGSYVFKERRSGNNFVEDFNDPLRNFSIRHTSFRVLDACFTPEHIAVSETGGETSLHALHVGRVVWKYSERDHHIIRLAYCDRRSEEHTSELQSRENLVCRLLLEKKKQKIFITSRTSYNTINV